VTRVCACLIVGTLAVVANPRNAVLCAGKRPPWPSLRRHGWVASESPDIDAITPAGLRALADAIERHGINAIRGVKETA
jgi:hypothetical protein